jgi:hypothetical protein
MGDPDKKTGLRDDRLATNGLSHVTTFYDTYCTLDASVNMINQQEVQCFLQFGYHLCA